MAVKPPRTPGYSHDPDAILDYPFKWAEFLADSHDSIATATVTPSTIDDDLSPLTVSLVTVAENGTDVVAWISGGTLGMSYTCVCHVVTNDGREEDQSINIVIQEH